MTRAPHRLPCALYFLGLTLVVGCTGPGIRLSAAPAEVTMGPFSSGSATAGGGVTVQSQNSFAGFVDLSSTCCRDVIRDFWSPLDGTGKIVVNLTPNTGLNVAGNGSATSAVSVYMPVQNSGPWAFLRPQIPFGKYLVRVTGKAQSDSSITSTADVGVRVLPASEPAPSCKTGIEVFPLGTVVLPSQIQAAEANPRKTTINIAILKATGPEAKIEAWDMRISDGAPIGFAIVTLEHASPKNEDKEISSVGCSTKGKFVRATKGTTSVQMLLSEAEDRTLYFRENVCTDFLCIGRTWVDVAVFAEPAFWSVFSGKRVHFRWLER